MKKLFILVALTAALTSGQVIAKGPCLSCQAQGQGQAQGQLQGQAQGQIGINKSTNNNNNQSSAKSGSYSGAKAGAAAGSISAVKIENTEVHPDDIEIRQLGTIYNNPNNNTAGCLKVWGIATGTKDAQGALGIPFESKNCNINQVASVAFAQGQYDLGWFIQCHNSKIKKIFGSVDECVAKTKALWVTPQQLGNANQNVDVPTHVSGVKHESINLVEEFSAK